MKKLLLCIATFMVCINFAQSVKGDEIIFTYVKLPSNPVTPKPTNYLSYVTASYEAENQKLLAQYEADKAQAEADYQREMTELPNKQKAADEKYEREMKAWNEKSTASKIIESKVLNENNHPVKDYVPQPYRRTVSAPTLKTSYDYNSLASTYLHIDGFEKGNANAMIYTVTLQGFESTVPRVVSEVKKEVSRVNNVSTTTDVTYYHLEFTYRHPMSFRVTNASNVEIYAASPAEFTEFKTYKGPATKTSPSTDITAMLKTMEDKILQENLTAINHLVNDRIGFEKTERKTEIYWVKSKNESHDDLKTAYNNAVLGFKLFGTSEEQGVLKINEAVAAWKNALLESDIEDKKARIDKDVTIALYYNLLEAYFITRNTTEADTILQTLGLMDLSNRDKKDVEKYNELYLNLKLRKAANGL
ncbi:MAG: hypothetical protein ACKO4Y_00210 [Flavobacteriales bacterium]